MQDLEHTTGSRILAVTGAKFKTSLKFHCKCLKLLLPLENTERLKFWQAFGGSLKAPRPGKLPLKLRAFSLVSLYFLMSLEIWAFLFVILQCISFPSSFDTIILRRGLYTVVSSAFTHPVHVRLYLGCFCEKGKLTWKQTCYLHCSYKSLMTSLFCFWGRRT